MPKKPTRNYEAVSAVLRRAAEAGTTWCTVRALWRALPVGTYSHAHIVRAAQKAGWELYEGQRGRSLRYVPRESLRQAFARVFRRPTSG